MSDSKPILRQVFDKAERVVGEPLEQLVGSKLYTDLLLTLKQVKDAIGGALGGAASGAAEKVLHLAQVPTRSDIRRLNRHLVEIATEVRTLSARQNEMRMPAASRNGATAAPTAATTTATRPQPKIAARTGAKTAAKAAKAGAKTAATVAATPAGNSAVESAAKSARATKTVAGTRPPNSRARQPAKTRRKVRNGSHAG